MLTITTCRTYPQPPQNLLPLADILNRQSVPTRFDIWQNRPSDPFLLPLCAWDYAAEPQAFRRWLDDAEKSGQQFVNPPPLMRWNMNKKYLCDLAAWGADVIPSVFAPPENQAVQNILRERGWQEAVIKPAVGQSGRAVARITAASPPPDWPAYPQGVIVQPYIRAIEQAGETSLIFFNGTFSHAVLRRPPQGEWRANSAYGVEIRPAAPSETVVRTARRVLDLLPQMPAYARVDGTIIGGRLLLNELELIEPALYLHTAQGAAERFAAG
ncbi:ATP-grasp domain-containing protein, partial [Neisseria oralis]|uniref:ATP-grasp domain-containing protein n=1 Tax=Neisseria oralis TaxID=1107316 RepID=UPI0027DFBF54